MEFEEMQIIWSEQNNEKLFAINENAMYKHIQRKGRSVEKLMGYVEWGMVITNFIIVIILTVDALLDGGPDYQYMISAVYLAYAIYAVYRRTRRQKAEVPYEPTMVGELDRAIWRLDYLIRQAKGIFYWYTLPLVVIVSVTFLLNDKWPWAVALILVLVPVSVFGPRWEINKWYLPKKRELEGLRETLVAEERG